MTFELRFTDEADSQLSAMEADKGLRKRLKAVQKALGYMETNLKHTSLNTHKFSSLIGPNGEEILESDAENSIAATYRIFWFYGPGKKVITVIAITPHP